VGGGEHQDAGVLLGGEGELESLQPEMTMSNTRLPAASADDQGQVVGRVVTELVNRVAALQDELEATQQALAAATGLLVIAAPAPSAQAAATVSKGRGGQLVQQRSRSPLKRPAGGGQQQQPQHVGMSAALGDGVASFVLFAVQQLRHAPVRPQRGTTDLLPSSAEQPGDGMDGGDEQLGVEFGGTLDAAPQPPATAAAATLDGATAEWLAQVLLDLLHAYEPEQTAAFGGLGKPAAAHQPAMIKPQQQGFGGGGGPEGLEAQQQIELMTGEGRGESARACVGGYGSPSAVLQLSRQQQMAGGSAAAAQQLPSVERLLEAVAAEARANRGRSTTPEPHTPKFVFQARRGGVSCGAASGGSAVGSCGSSPQRQARSGVSPARR